VIDECTAAGGRHAREDVLRAMAASFHYLHGLFRAPGTEQWAWLNSAECGAFWRALGEHLDIADASEDPGLPADSGEYESQYIAAFEAGTPHAPLPLIESHHNRRDPVPRVLHENVLFYQAFGLRLRSSANETADHLRHQLEFVAHLFGLEAEAEAARGDAGAPVCPGTLSPENQNRDQIRRARREYLERHLSIWVPQAARIAADAPYPWVRRYLEMTRAAVTVAGSV
jgi:TorA maturation chaperone TorD